jgi:hypothetical protein
MRASFVVIGIVIIIIVIVALLFSLGYLHFHVK